MLVGIDGNEANVFQKVGVNVYAYEIIKNLRKLSENPENKLRLIVYLKEKPLSDMPEETANFKYKIINGANFWILTKLMPYLWFTNEKPDIFFAPSHYLPVFVPMPQVCSIMDVGYLEFSEQFTLIDFWQLKLWSAISILTAKRVISISKSTKDDIVRHYPFAESKIYVTPLGFDRSQFNLKISQKDVRRVKNKYSIVDDYVLYLGTLKPSKNVESLAQAFSMLNDKLQMLNLKLVIAGKKGWLYESIFNKVKDLGLSDRVIFTDFIPEDDKPALIKGAKVLAIPSFWEGFGLDALNAMACGVVVVASNVGSLPEVVGSAGIAVDPYSINSIAEGLKKVLSMSKSDYNKQVSLGLAQAKKFSWEKTAKATLEILKNVQGQNR